MRSLHRRDYLAGMIATGALAMLDPPAAAAPRRQPFFKRIGRPIGLQLYTLGDEAGKDLDATFAQVAAIGYRDLELPSLYNRKPADVRAAADRAGLAISSLHVPAASRGPVTGLSFASPAQEIADALGALGARNAVMPIMPFPDNFRPGPGENIQAAIGRSVAAAGPDLWKRTAALLNRSGAALKPLGVAVGYHNHNVEFAPLGNTNGWTILARETDPKLVHFEIDTGWIATSGLDPVAFLNRHRGRVRQLHAKDVAAANPVNYVLTMQPSDVGAGAIDWARVLPAAHRAGVRHFYLEQEPPFPGQRIDSVRRGYAFLAGLRA